MRMGTVRRHGVFPMLVCFLMMLAACGPISIGPAATEVPPTPTDSPATPTLEPPTPTPPPPTAETAPQAAPAGVECTVRAINGLRMRGGPGTNFPVSATLPLGEVVNAVARNEQSNWLVVRTRGGAQGWVSAEFVNCQAAPNTLPVAPPG